MESPRISPQPDEAEREAILLALAAEEAERPIVSGWAEARLPARTEDDDQP